jgi:chemotaxis protein methyltransferase CheR
MLPKQENSSQASWLRQIAELVNHLTGIQLGEQQTAMLESRLQKRIRTLKLASPQAYLEYVRDNLQSEGAHLVSLLTTHHTFFLSGIWPL